MILDTFSEFSTGHFGVDSIAKPILQTGYAPQVAFHGIRLCALSTNTVDIFAGRNNVTVNSGFALPAGKEVFIPLETPSDVYVVATPTGNTISVVTIDAEAGTFTLNGSDPIPYDSVAATVETALEDIFGAGNVTVSGDGPYTLEFIADLAATDVVLTGSATDGTVSIVSTMASAGSVVSWLVV